MAEPTVENQKVLVETSVTGTFAATVEELELATTYYVRAFATNEAGTAYGDVVTMTTKGEGFNCGDDVVGVNGNIYGSIQIGTGVSLFCDRSGLYRDLPRLVSDKESGENRYADVTLRRI